MSMKDPQNLGDFLAIALPLLLAVLVLSLL